MQHRLVKLGARAPWLMGVVNDARLPAATAGSTWRPMPPSRMVGNCWPTAPISSTGGESTAPGSRPITGEQELARLEPVVRAMAHEATLSIDTYHAATAARCIELGAGIVNDVSAMRADPDMAAVIRDLRPVLVMMHAKDGPLPHATDRPPTMSIWSATWPIGSPPGSTPPWRRGIAPTRSCSTPAGASS